ncbi:MAG: TIGR02266 family protein, partial [Myxococcaceae bacterium]|nr:TIGR02266 family protein [Myxococcaceae bacterium]
MRDAQQAAVGLVVKLPFATPEEFLAKYGTHITRGGIYLRSKTVKPPGTPVTLDLRLTGGQRIIYASAVVHFVTGQSGPGVSGMGLRFLVVDPETERFLESAVATLPHAASLQPPIPNGVGEATWGPDGPGAPLQLKVLPNLGIAAAPAPAPAPVPARAQAAK